MKKKIPCPICKTPAIWQDNPFRPFCSERCKLTDLGQWAEGNYAIPAKDEAPSRDDNHEED